jgi:hypothetical protein
MTQTTTQTIAERIAADAIEHGDDDLLDTLEEEAPLADDDDEEEEERTTTLLLAASDEMDAPIVTSFNSHLLPTSLQRQVAEYGYWGAYRDAGGRVMLVIEGGDEPVDTGLYCNAFGQVS